jgi:hypothetical protein
MAVDEIGAAELVFSNAFYEVRVLDGGWIICVARSATPFMSKEEIDAGCLPVQHKLDRLGRAGKRLLLDTRLAVGNNNPSFEANFATHRKRMADGFKTVALLVQTLIGKLHNERLVQEDQAGAPRVFMDAGQALAYLREKIPLSRRVGKVAP